MNKARVRFALLALFLPFLLHATHILKNDLLNPKAVKLVEQMTEELQQKTGVHEYLIATNEHFPVGFNLVAYTKKYEKNISKPYVILIFAPFAKITEASEQRGRVGIIPSSKEIASMYDRGDILDATIDVVVSIDKNSAEDKNTIGMVQGISELADQIAAKKGLTLESTIKEARQGIWFVKIIVLIGAALVFWMFLFRPLYIRIKNGKKS
jgi:hypothetical protein